MKEDLTHKKYPKYAEYQKRVPLYVPNVFNIWKGRDGGDEQINETTPLVGGSTKE